MLSTSFLNVQLRYYHQLAYCLDLANVPFLSFPERLVDCGALKRAIEIVYTATLPKASKPFIYMSIILPPEHVDVNIHPTKREVSMILYMKLS